MLSKVKFEQKSLEVYVSSSITIIALIIVELALSVVIYFFATNDAISGRYIFLGIAIFFFIAIASGLLPQITNMLNDNRQLMWGANAAGILIPAVNTTLTAMKPPVLVGWNEVNKMLFVDELTEYNDGKSVSWNRLLIVFNKKNPPEGILSKLHASQHKLQGGFYYQIFDYPKQDKDKIIKSLKEFSAGSAAIEILAKYET